MRPAMRLPRGGMPPAAIVAGAIVAALLLFEVLNVRRHARGAPAVAARAAELPGQGAVPPLYIPPDPPALQRVPAAAIVPAAPAPVAAAAPAPRATYGPPPVAMADTAPPPPPQPGSAGNALVIDNAAARITGTTAAAAPGAPADTPSGANGAARVHAGVFANRSTTVPQGTLIPAVLETGFDSTRPGFARALVQRDIRGFDGTRILIPRGSRLIGEYRADTAPGQKRAMIAWSRLIRPDGASIAIGSPAADPVGRGGVKADVDNHFLAQFAGAILQSALDIGVNLASRSADSSVVLLPGSLSGATQPVVPQYRIPPTLRVRGGTSVAVFVARDLDFTDVESSR